MQVENPIPRAYALLSLALPLVLAAGFALAERASDDRQTRRVIAPALAIAAWLSAVCAIARLFHAFLPGLALGTLLVAAGGAVHLAPRLRALTLHRPAREAWPVIAFAVVAVIAIWPAVQHYFHDETIPTGHLSTVCQLQNGHYPPRYSFFPQYEFKYHYGFDVLAAMVSGLFRTSVATSIDVVTVVMWAYTVFLAAHLGQRLAGARFGVLTAFFALWGGGMPFGCPSFASPIAGQLLGDCFTGGFKFNPPVSAYFFQHPFGLGIPLALAALCLLADRESGPRPWRYASFGVLFVALYLGQVVLFFGLGASLAVAECFEGRHLSRTRALFVLATLVPVAIAAKNLGAWGAPAPYEVGRLLDWHPGVADTWKGTLIWHTRVYALLLPLGLLGIALMRRERLVLILLVAGCLVVTNTVRYKQTWDIVKFATVAQLVLSIGASAVAVRLLQWRPSRRVVGALRGVLVAVMALGCTAGGMAYHATIWAKLPLKPNMEWKPADLTAADITVMDYLRRHARADDLAYRRRDVSFNYNQWGGLNIPWLLSVDNHGFGPKDRQPRLDLMAKLPPELPKYLAQGITWFVLDPQDGPLRAAADRWVKQGDAEVVLEVGGLRVVHAKRR
jgi:hypothetical protein